MEIFRPTGSPDSQALLVPRGAILGRDLSHIEEDIDLNAEADIQEFVAHSWYDYSGGKDAGLHPYKGETKLNYSGPQPPYAASGYRGELFLAQVTALEGHTPWKWGRWRASSCCTPAVTNRPRNWPTKALKQLDLPLEAMFSTMGRTAARTLECKIFADAMPQWFDSLMANIKAGDVRTFNETLWEPSTWPRHAQGVGFTEAPRGALGHWIVIDEGRISNYQAVVPSTWNAGPRDAAGIEGPYEAALKGQSVQDPKQPLEILRTIHSFDPCLACAVHVVDPDGEELIQVRVQ